jgi:hypothetical protein
VDCNSLRVLGLLALSGQLRCKRIAWHASG